MKKRFFCFLIVLIITMCFMSTFAFAATSGNCGSKLQWRLDTSTGVLTISGSGAMNSTVPWYDNANKIKTVVIQSGATSICNEAFADCTKLESVTLPDTLTAIGDYAFDGCTALASITIPQSVRSIGIYAFDGCTSLKKVYISNMQKWCGISFANVYSNPLSNGADLYLNNTLVTNLTIPSIDTIKVCAFAGCTSITYVSIPSSVDSIESSAFYDCSSLESVIIPEGVTKINRSTFTDCSSLVSVSIPSTLTYIDSWAFDGCDSLEKVYTAGLKSWCKIGFADTTSNPLNNGASLYVGSMAVTDVTIPEGITKIKDYAFERCASIRTVTIPSHVASIGESAFYECPSLKTVTVEDGVVTIGDFAFSSCKSLSKVKLPMSIISIGEYAFEYCSALKAFDIPSEVNEIGEGVFNSSAIEYVYIPKAVSVIKTGAFGYTNLKNVYYGGSDTDIQNISILHNNESLTSAKWIYNATGTPNIEPEIKDTSVIFTDIKKNAWYRQYVDYVFAYEIFTGTTKTQFSPNANITRAQFVQVLANLSGVDTTNRNVTTGFFDVPRGKWFTSAVKWASENGVVSGMGKGKFEPNANVTREQMCVMLTNYAKFEGITLVKVENKQTFADDNKISKWAKTAVYNCQMADIVNGKGAGKFDPKGTGTRAEASVMFEKFHKDYMA